MPHWENFAFVKDYPLGSAVTLGGLLLRDAFPLGELCLCEGLSFRKYCPFGICPFGGAAPLEAVPLDLPFCGAAPFANVLPFGSTVLLRGLSLY